MARKAGPGGPRERVSATLDPKNVAWARERIAAGDYRNMSHVLDRALALLRERAGRAK